MMNFKRTSLLLILLIAIKLRDTYAQIKTSYQHGIKTHYPPQQIQQYETINNTSYSNVKFNATESRGNEGRENYYGTYNNRNFIAAETYQGENNNQFSSGLAKFGEQYYASENLLRKSSEIRQPEHVDPIREFINKTRSDMASGVCYKEVPTSTLSKSDIVGNGTTPNMSKIQICCDGYERNPHVFKRCDPVCKDGCQNGICTAPNTCVCMPNHVRNQANQCVATCPVGCQNGVCNELNQCQCKHGFIEDFETKKYCVPFCESGCKYGKCLAPNYCVCQEGYQQTAAGACAPKCNGCVFGECIAPGQCKCNIGYRQVGESCEPICALGCKLGRCIAPDTCACDLGYEISFNGTSCQPSCQPACLNGTCVENNVCNCNIGYIANELQSHICKPNCPQGCPNGYCKSPNVCACNPGFIKSGIKGRLTCVRA